MGLSKRWVDMPEPLKRLFFTPSMWKALNCFKDGAFGITSGFTPDRPKRENLASQLLLVQRLDEHGYSYLPQIGWWEGVHERSLFVPNMKKELTQALAKEFGQDAYIWGLKGHWRCRDCFEDKVLCEGSQMKIAAPDSEFIRYCSLLERRASLLADLESVQISEDEMKTRTAQRIERELAVLERRLANITDRD